MSIYPVNVQYALRSRVKGSPLATVGELIRLQRTFAPEWVTTSVLLCMTYAPHAQAPLCGENNMSNGVKMRGIWDDTQRKSNAYKTINYRPTLLTKSTKRVFTVYTLNKNINTTCRVLVPCYMS